MKSPEQQLQTIRVKKLSPDEKARVWHATLHHIMTEPRTLSLFTRMSLVLMTRHALVVTLVILVVIAGGGGATVFASNGARPGDLLFPVERAVEEVQIAIASAPKKKELKVAFAKERIAELTEIIQEETHKQDTAKSSSTVALSKKKSKKQPAPTASTTATSTATSSAGFAFTTPEETGTTSDELASSSDELVDVESKELPEESRKRIENGLATAVAFLAEAKEAVADAEPEAKALDAIVDDLNTTIEELPSDTLFTVEVEKKNTSVITPTEKVVIGTSTTALDDETIVVQINEDSDENDTMPDDVDDESVLGTSTSATTTMATSSATSTVATSSINTTLFEKINLPKKKGRSELLLLPLQEN